MGHGRKDKVWCGVVSIRIGIALEVSPSSIINIQIPHERKDEEEDLRSDYQSLFSIKSVLITIIFRG